MSISPITVRELARELETDSERIAQWALALASEGGFSSDENYLVRAADWRDDLLVGQCAELIRLTRGQTTGLWTSGPGAPWYSTDGPRPAVETELENVARPGAEQTVTVRMPRSHWRQIVGDIENMCGTSADDIEILASVEILEGTP